MSVCINTWKHSYIDHNIDADGHIALSYFCATGKVSNYDVCEKS